MTTSEKYGVSNLSDQSMRYLDSIGAKIVQVMDGGMYSNVDILLSNGAKGRGYWPVGRPLNIDPFSFESANK